MAQPQPDQNIHHLHKNTNSCPQLQLPQTCRNSLDLILDERKGGIKNNNIRSSKLHQVPKSEDLSPPLVKHRPRRTRTTFNIDQLILLETYFLKGRYLTTPRLHELSEKLALSTTQVKIWFKNRRRRAKMQLNQRCEFAYDDVSLSPPNTSNSSNTETDESVGGDCTESGSLSSLVGQRSLPSWGLNDSVGSTTNPLTPASNLVTNYVESAFDSYFYNNRQASSHPSHQHNSTNSAHVVLTPSCATSNTQYYPLPPSYNILQHHQHQQQDPATYRYHFPIQYNNFDNPFYMPLPRSLTTNSTATTVQTTSVSPSSVDYERIKQKNSKNSSQYNGIGSGDPKDNLNDIKTILPVLDNNNNNSSGATCSSKNGITYGSCANPALNTVAKQCRKLTSDSNDSNYLYTMDTLMHAYNGRSLNSATHTQQFATYCFN